MKRVFDIVVSLIGLITLSPFFIIIPLLIKIKMPGPIFFCQKRIGRFGVPFLIHKFRTMIVHHEGNTISVKGEKRITRFGALLRKFKIDELPELWNVLKGDMSIVGPRPDVPYYMDKLSGDEKIILKFRPGITGPASLKYVFEEELLSFADDPEKVTDEVIWPDKVKINMDYCHNRSFMGDIYIIYKTILITFFKKR